MLFDMLSDLVKCAEAYLLKAGVTGTIGKRVDREEKQQVAGWKREQSDHRIPVGSIVK